MLREARDRGKRSRTGFDFLPAYLECDVSIEDVHSLVRRMHMRLRAADARTAYLLHKGEVVLGVVTGSQRHPEVVDEPVRGTVLVCEHIRFTLRIHSVSFGQWSRLTKARATSPLPLP